MASAFDPYANWLGLATSPANHYQLLGLPLLESDRSAIAAAADKQMARLTPHLAGPRGAAAQRILADIAAARAVLASPVEKARYDATVRSNADLTSEDGLLPPMASHAPAIGTPAHAVIGSPAPPVTAEQSPAESPLALDSNENRVNAARQRVRRAKQSSNLRFLATGAVVLLLVVGGGLAFSHFQPQQVAQSDTQPATDAAVAGTVPDQPTSNQGMPDGKTDAARVQPAEQQPVDQTPSPEPSQLPDTKAVIPADEPAMDDVGMDAPSDVPDPAAMPAEMATEMPTEKPAGEPTDKPAIPPVGEPVPEPSTPPLPADAPPTAEEVAAVDKAVAAARRAMVRGQVELAQEQLDLVTLEVSSPALLERIERTAELVSMTTEFWKAVQEGLKGLAGGDEISINGQTVVIVEIKADQMTVRSLGKNRRYKMDEMPANLAFALAERWFKADEPSTPAFLGAWLVVHPQGDKAQARALWAKAAAAGVDMTLVQPELDAAAP